MSELDQKFQELPLTYDEIEKELSQNWRRFANHRKHINEILGSIHGSSHQNLSIWGAGPCLDINLSQLLPIYENIGLVDINKNALAHVGMMEPDLNLTRIQLFDGVDLFGLHTTLEEWKLHMPDEHSITEAITITGSHSLPQLKDQYDVVLSDCVLSQIIFQVLSVLGETNSQLLPMIQVIRSRHLELMLAHTSPGGYAILVTDIVSSLTAPILLKTPDELLKQAMIELINTKNFFTGCNPYAIARSCEMNKMICDQIETIEMTDPWLWQLKEDQVQLVCCLMIKKSDKISSTQPDHFHIIADA